jgi:hypothetical protein
MCFDGMFILFIKVKAMADIFQSCVRMNSKVVLFPLYDILYECKWGRETIC